MLLTRTKRETEWRLLSTGEELMTTMHFPLSEEEGRREAASLRRDFFLTGIIVAVLAFAIVTVAVFAGLKWGLI